MGRGIVNRFRGQQAYNGVLTSQLNHFSSSPVATPTITNSGNSSVDGRMITAINFNKEAHNDTDGVAVAGRFCIFWHLETTAAALLAPGTVSAVGSANTSGNTAVGIALADSTGANNSGRGICSSTGGLTLALTSTGTSTARMFLTLPNGQVVAGSTLVFT